MLVSRLTALVSTGCRTNRSLVWHNCEQNRSHCEHTFAVKSRKLSRTFVSNPQRLAKATLVRKRQPREARLHSAKASADAATADSLTTPEYATMKLCSLYQSLWCKASNKPHTSTESFLLTCSTPEVRKAPAPVFTPQQRGPLDNKYVWGLIFQQRAHLVAAGVSQLACTHLGSCLLHPPSIAMQNETHGHVQVLLWS